jgi:hypothetical protein
VLLAKPYLPVLQNLKDDEIMQRFRLVGGSLRDISTFEEEAFQNAVNTALDIRKQGTVQGLVEGRCAPMP